MPAFDKQYQTRYNGPLTRDFINRINRVKAAKRLTLADLGERFGVSGAFVSAMLRESSPQATRTANVSRYVQAIEALEHVEETPNTSHGAAIQPPNVTAINVPTSDPRVSQGDSLLTRGHAGDPDVLEVLIREANKRGFSVTLSPIR